MPRISLQDALVDEDLYAAWLVREFDTDVLAGQVGEELTDDGYTIPTEFQEAFDNMPHVVLAEWLATNTTFSTGDDAWRAHCEATYSPDEHPTLTAEEINGAGVHSGIGASP